MFLVAKSNEDRIPVNDEEVSLGRGPLLKITDPRISRKEAILNVGKSGDITLTPKRNCVILNGKFLAVDVAVPCKHGDTISFNKLYDYIIQEDEADIPSPSMASLPPDEEQVLSQISPPTITLLISSSESDVIELTIDRHATVGELESLLEKENEKKMGGAATKKHGRDENKKLRVTHRLVFQGRFLESGELLSRYSIADGHLLDRIEVTEEPSASENESFTPPPGVEGVETGGRRDDEKLALERRQSNTEVNLLEGLGLGGAAPPAIPRPNRKKADDSTLRKRKASRPEVPVGLDADEQMALALQAEFDNEGTSEPEPDIVPPATKRKKASAPSSSSSSSFSSSSRVTVVDAGVAKEAARLRRSKERREKRLKQVVRDRPDDVALKGEREWRQKLVATNLAARRSRGRKLRSPDEEEEEEIAGTGAGSEEIEGEGNDDDGEWHSGGDSDSDSGGRSSKRARGGGRGKPKNASSDEEWEWDGGEDGGGKKPKQKPKQKPRRKVVELDLESGSERGENAEGGVVDLSQDWDNSSVTGGGNKPGINGGDPGTRKGRAHRLVRAVDNGEESGDEWGRQHHDVEEGEGKAGGGQGDVIDSSGDDDDEREGGDISSSSSSSSSSSKGGGARGAVGRNFPTWMSSKASSSKSTTKPPNPKAGNKKKSGGGDGVKRARTAFMFYSQQNRGRVKEANPDATFGELARLVGAAWKALDDDEKEEYNMLAREDKIRADRERRRAKAGAGGGDGDSSSSSSSED